MPVLGHGQLFESVTQEWKNSGETASITVSSNKQPAEFLYQVTNRPFAGSDHMVRNKLHWDANNVVGLPKQRNLHQSSSTFLCFESTTALFASQSNLFRTCDRILQRAYLDLVTV